MRAFNTNSEENSVCELVGYAQEQYFRTPEALGAKSDVWELEGSGKEKYVHTPEAFGAKSENDPVWGFRTTFPEQHFRQRKRLPPTVMNLFSSGSSSVSGWNTTSA